MTLYNFLLAFLFSTTTLFPSDAPLEKAPDFEFVLADGSSKKLSDYEGQVLYISFWASWCGPCLTNFEKYEATRKELERIGVVLLNISVDKTEEAYKSSLIRQPIVGNNAWISDQSSIQEAYELYAIPTYHIITKDGDFYFLGDGSGRDVFGEFRALLEQ